MRYFLMISLAALFLLACGDTDNPVVPTAPAGKATVDLAAEECAAAESLPDGFLEQARAVDPDIDAERLLSTWQAYGCTDWAAWGLLWLASLNEEETFAADSPTPPSETDSPTPPSETDGPTPFFGVDGPTPFFGVAHLDPPAIQTEPHTHSTPIEVGVTGTMGDGNAVFTFSRTGDTSDHLTFGFSVARDNFISIVARDEDGNVISDVSCHTTSSVTSGFRPGISSFTYSVGFTHTVENDGYSWDPVREGVFQGTPTNEHYTFRRLVVSIEHSSLNPMNDSYGIVSGKGSAGVGPIDTNNSNNCPP